MNDLIILFYPKTGQDLGLSVSPPHALLSIAAELVDEYSVVIIDQRVEKSWQNKLKNKLSKQPICVGISSMIGSQIKYAIQAAEFIRKINSDVPIVWGGIHTTTLPEQSITDPVVDVIVKNEGEITFKELIPFLKQFNGSKVNNRLVDDLKNLKGICFQHGKTIYNTPDREFIDLNNLKSTPWHLINVERYIYHDSLTDDSTRLKRVLDIGSTTRGCVRGCKFCYQTVFNKCKWRALSVEKTVNMFIENALNFKLDGIWLRDDNFFINPARVENVSNGLLNEYKKNNISLTWYSSGIDIKTFFNLGSEKLTNLWKSGCKSFRIGIESGSDRVLGYIGKSFNVKEVIEANRWMFQHKFTPHFAFMGGFPTETYSELLQTVNLIDILKKDNPNAKLHQLSIFNPIPGTPLFEEAISHGFIPYKSLREYAEKSHFFSKKMDNFGHLLIDPNLLNNISDMSYLINDYLEYGFPVLFRPLIHLLGSYFRYIWAHRMFKARLDLNIYRSIRNHMFNI